MSVAKKENCFTLEITFLPYIHLLYHPFCHYNTNVPFQKLPVLFEDMRLNHLG